MRSMLLPTFAALTFMPAAYAADLLPVGTLDPQATAGVIAADPLRDGEMRGGLHFVGRHAVSGTDALDLKLQRQSGAKAQLRDANSVSAVIGFGVTPVLGLALGMHGSYEHMPATQRDAFFAEDHRTGVADWRGSFSQTRVSGASFLLKLNIFKSNETSFSLAPFLESGIGEAATYSLTRSIGPKAGVMALASYGAKGAARLHLNLGWRHRDAELVAKHTLHQEVFYKALAEGFLSKSFSLFVAGEGRQWQIGAASASGAQSVQNGASLSGGFQAYVGAAQLSAFVGQSLANPAGVGMGERSYGVNLAFAIGDALGHRSPKTRYATDIQRGQASQAAQKAAGKEGPKSFVDEVEAVFPAQGDYVEMGSEPTEDFLENASQGISDGDFTSSVKEAEQNRIPAGELSDDEKVQLELTAIRQAEAEANRKREAQEAAENERLRKTRAKQAKEEEKLMQEWLREAQSGVDAEYGKDATDVDWQGLED